MDHPSPTFYNPDDYTLIRASSVKIHKKTSIRGSKNIQILGPVIIKERVIIRGDLAPIIAGNYVNIHENVTLKPTYKRDGAIVKFCQMSIGDNVIIQSDTIIEALKIGSNVYIGKNCIISHRCIIGDCVIINDDSIVPPDSVIPAYSEYGGRPALLLSELPETAQDILKERAKTCYKSFVPIKK